MFIFFKKNESTISLPSENVILIQQTQNVISIKYHTGNYYSEIAELSTSNTDVEIAPIYYSSDDEAAKKMKEFYWAVSKNTGAFMF